MLRTLLRTVGLIIIALIPSLHAGDWLTFGHDPQRTGWSPEERKISPATVPAFQLLWKSKLKNASFRLSALTAPVVASDVTASGSKSVVYVAGITGTVFAMDAATGAEIWTHTFRSVALPGKGQYQGTFLCPNGITATPVIDKSTRILYLIAGDGALYGLDLATGAVRFGPVQFVAPFSKNWSLNLVDGILYTVLTQGCGGGISGFYSIDVSNAHHPTVRQLLLSNTDTAGIWGRGGPIVGANGRVYGSTADGHFDPQVGDYSNTVISATLPDLNIADYYLPPNWAYLNKKDLDMGASSPVYFGWRNRHLLASGAKESVVSLLDADALGGADHQTALFRTPKLGNEKDICCQGLGIWGGLSTARDDEGQTWLYVPLGGAPSSNVKFSQENGDLARGSILAFRVVADGATQDPKLEPAWITGGFDMPDPPVIAGGVVFALSTGENAVQKGNEDNRLLNTHPAILRALDAKTGKELYNSASAMESWVHFSGLAVADGRVYAVDHNSNVYCFGVPAKP